MKKILTTLLTLSSFVFILILPLFLGIYSSVISHHGMSSGDCIEHCMSGKIQGHDYKIAPSFSFTTTLVIKLVFPKVFEFTIPLLLLYIIFISAPPNLFRSIKNYSYGNLIGVVKLST